MSFDIRKVNFPLNFLFFFLIGKYETFKNGLIYVLKTNIFQVFSNFLWIMCTANNKMLHYQIFFKYNFTLIFLFYIIIRYMYILSIAKYDGKRKKKIVKKI